VIAKRSALLLIAFASAVSTVPALAQMQIYPREQDVPDVRLGQKVQVDDGSCPTGQIKEIVGTTLTTAGVTRVAKCVPRMGTKKR
jgi:formylmethanofuran:tetrahydromethanopterin formyltransferase